ncbi:MAG: peptidoglycan DD-metalloendopeptidase family protein [Candidatus Peribacteraceae bacterium]
MKTKIHKIQAWLSRQWNDHGHFAASTLCGLLFGVIFAMNVALNRAAVVQEMPDQRQAVSTYISTSVIPRGEKRDDLSFSLSTRVVQIGAFARPPFTTLQKREPASSPVTPVVVAVVEQSISSSEASVVVETKKHEQSEPQVIPDASVQVPEPVAPENPRVPRAPRPVVERLVAEPPAAEPKEIKAPEVQTPAVQSSPVAEAPEVVQNPTDDFPAFGRTLHPVAHVPNWGAMTTSAEWNRTYSQMTEADFVPIPRYDMAVLTTPMNTLLKDRSKNVAAITAKLYYSTRYMGTYDLDSSEHTGSHPGVDLKLARGTLVGSVAGGRVFAIKENDVLGKYVVIEHRRDGQQFFSIYGHLDSATVSVGDDVKPGQGIGRVGMTGKTVSAHLHLEVNRGFLPDSWVNLHGAAGSGEGSVHPMTFIATGGKGG